MALGKWVLSALNNVQLKKPFLPVHLPSTTQATAIDATAPSDNSDHATAGQLAQQQGSKGFTGCWVVVDGAQLWRDRPRLFVDNQIQRSSADLLICWVTIDPVEVE